MPVYLQISEGNVSTTVEVFEGCVFVDLDERGRVLGIEILNPWLINPSNGANNT